MGGVVVPRAVLAGLQHVGAAPSVAVPRLARARPTGAARLPLVMAIQQLR